MTPTIELLEEDATTTTLRMPTHLAKYFISISLHRDDFDIDFHELSMDEVTPELLALAEQARSIPREKLINI